MTLLSAPKKVRVEKQIRTGIKNLVYWFIFVFAITDRTIKNASLVL